MEAVEKGERDKHCEAPLTNIIYLADYDAFGIKPKGKGSEFGHQ